MRIMLITLLALYCLAAPAQQANSTWQDYQIARKQAHKNWIHRHPYWTFTITAGSAIATGFIVHHELDSSRSRTSLFTVPSPPLGPRPLPITAK